MKSTAPKRSAIRTARIRKDSCGGLAGRRRLLDARIPEVRRAVRVHVHLVVILDRRELHGDRQGKPLAIAAVVHQQLVHVLDEVLRMVPEARDAIQEPRVLLGERLRLHVLGQLVDPLLGSFRERLGGPFRGVHRLLHRIRLRKGYHSRHTSGADLSTSSKVVRPCATFAAPDTRSGRIPAMYAAWVSGMISYFSV